ncbi:NAD-dependent epimerase [Iodidimonas gelatinilytica]|uniref:NAD-dependent epimerase n=2 Tax=Iodidimonas gelatinilytica TaxID=1236966 RepID=A0A5A7MVH4_9PROT|nr:NAD-dependent epimerase [Iodidimonas gelatinilytica]
MRAGAMMITFEGKNFLVTGASKGIGAATAHVLLKAGANVALHWHNDEAQAAILAETFGPDRTHLFRADLGDQQAVRGLFVDAVKWAQSLHGAGRLDGIVNNAATMPYSGPEDARADWDADWDQVWRVNVRAVADLCREAVLHFRESGPDGNRPAGGMIVNIASRAAFRGDMPDAMHYAASKGAVVALTRSLAKGYAQDGIRAYCVAPGWVRTDRVASRIDESPTALAEIPMGAAAPPEEVGNLVAFLLSGLAHHATGATIDINGASYFH